ncbi:MAG: trypsin-like peptidase domain-containing protein [bacterium]|nr:trypsin-like peptidase domain-containing protein [bacterium]
MIWDGLVIVYAHSDGEHSIGTGILVADGLCLTARHVIAPSGDDPLDAVQVRFHVGVRPWLDVEIAWENDDIDAVLLRLPPIDGPPPTPVLMSSQVELPATEWTGMGYPVANLKTAPDELDTWQVLSLQGKLFEATDGRQDLSVEGAPAQEGWRGCSGAPVLANGRLVAMILQAPQPFRGGRLRALTTAALLERPGFRKTVGWDEWEREELLQDVRLEIEAKLEGAPHACRELARTVLRAGQKEPVSGSAEDPGFLSTAVLEGLDLADAIAVVNNAHARLCRLARNDDAAALRTVLDLIMPLLFDRGIAYGVRRQTRSSPGLIAIPVATQTLAEVVMAAADERATRFGEPDEGEDPVGVARIEDPEIIDSGITPGRLIDKLIADLASYLKVSESGSKREERIKAELNVLASRAYPDRLPVYVVLHRPEDGRRRSAEWAEVKRRFPQLRILELTSDDRGREWEQVSIPLRSLLTRDKDSKRSR